MPKVDFIKYYRRKFPLSLTIEELVSFKDIKGEEFEVFLSKKLTDKDTFDSLLLMFHMMLRRGSMMKLSSFKQTIYKIFTGNNYGIRSKNLHTFFSERFGDWLSMIGEFYLYVNIPNEITDDINEVKKN